MKRLAPIVAALLVGSGCAATAFNLSFPDNKKDAVARVMKQVRPRANAPQNGQRHSTAAQRRVRADRSLGAGRHGLQLWLTADPVRLAAANVVELARARFSLD